MSRFVTPPNVAAAGGGALAWVAGQVAESKAFLRAAQRANAQIDADLRALGATGRLPDAQPVLLVGGVQSLSKVVIALLSLVIGAVGVGLLLLVAQVSFGETVPRALVGSVAFGVLLGWIPAVPIFIVWAFRENNRRSAGVAIEHYREYRAARTQAQDDLAHGAPPFEVAQFLSGFRLPVEEALADA